MVKFKKAPKRKLRFGKTRHSAKYNIFLAPMRKHLICAMATYAITQEIFLGLKSFQIEAVTQLWANQTSHCMISASVAINQVVIGYATDFTSVIPLVTLVIPLLEDAKKYNP